ncbi:MAG: protoheme IX farnesyltransferase [Candidatus Omnitrophica bacterium]|nr:protoheme IX farnesyltransferase [Candidatus Omnitrophota bacterium]
MIFSYFELTKSRLMLMVLATAFLGFWMSSGQDHNLLQFLKMIFGTFLVGGGANALNQFFERETDARMKRTRNRPIPSGRLTAQSALLFGGSLTIGGTAFLWTGVNALTGMIGALAAFSYIFVYTPLKRKTTLNTFVGALPGALPVVMGWTAAGGKPDPQSLALFWILYFWQLPHFFAIARIYREDYRQSGLRMMAIGEDDAKKAAWQIVLFSALLVPVTITPARIGMTGVMYLATALAAGAAFLTFALYMAVTKLSAPKKFIPASILYLTLLIAFMIADKQ